MMRAMNQHQYIPAGYDPVIQGGYIRTVNVNGVATTWAVSRPSLYPTPKYSPPAELTWGSGVGFSPAKPNVEMDPSNPQTWQRSYRFTN